MKGDITNVSFGSELREKLLRGVDLIGNQVGLTMGPYGRNNLIERRVHTVPIVTNDGKRAAKAINPKDPIERMVVRALSNAAENTDLKTGDGTTGTIVLAQAIIHTALEKISDPTHEKLGIKAKKISVVALKKEIDKAKELALAELKKQRKKIKTIEELTDVAVTSVEDEKLGKIIAEMVMKIGENGYIFAEEGFTFETETEVIEGMKFPGKVAANFMLNNPNRMELSLEKTKVLVTNMTVKDMGDFIKPKGGSVFADIQETGDQHCALIAWKFEKKFLLDVADLWRKTGFRIYCIKVPAILTEQLKDVAIYVGGSLLDENQNMKISDAHVENMGQVNRLTANAEECVLVGGHGKKEEIKKRIKEIEEQIKIEKIPEFKPRLKQRIADLSSGVGIVRVGHNTQLEQLYVLDKVQDAVLATKEALRDGVVKGGGLALKEIAEKLPENILTESLKAPYHKIQENAGEEFEIPKNVVDPYNVIKVSLENACSVAGALITTGGAIYDEEDYTLEDFKNEIKKWADKVERKENPIPEDPALDR